jgi:hypothetical protein
VIVYGITVELDDPDCDVGTSGIYAVRHEGQWLVGGHVGDVAEWVFDAEADSYECAVDLIMQPLDRHLAGEPSPVPTDRRVESAERSVLADDEHQLTARAHTS